MGRDGGRGEGARFLVRTARELGYDSGSVHVQAIVIEIWGVGRPSGTAGWLPPS